MRGEKKLWHDTKLTQAQSCQHYVTNTGWYVCEKCLVYFRSHTPYKLIRFKYENIWYAIPRPNNKNPDCPNCLDNIHVGHMKKYDKRVCIKI